MVFKSQFGTNKKDEKALKAIAKAMATTGQGSGMEGIMIPDIDEEILKLQVPEAPWFSYLRGVDRLDPTKSWEVKYYEKNRSTTSSWIKQSDNIPDFTESDFEEKTAEMKLLVYPIEIGDFVTKSENRIDIAKDETDDAMLDMAGNVNDTLFNGTGSSSSKDFTGILNQITTNVHDADGNPLTKKMVDEAAKSVVENKGNVGHLVVTPNVHSLLEDLLYPGVRNVNTVEMTLGYNVMSYMTPQGISVPIITDPDLGKDGKDRMVFADNSVLRMKELLPPTGVDLAKLKLSDSKVIVQAITYYNRAEFRNAVLEGIDFEAGVAFPDQTVVQPPASTE